jgi:hypothetical protein
MTEQDSTLERLSDYVRRIEEYEDELDREIILSTDVDPEPLTDSLDIAKTPVVWPLMDAKMFYYTDVPPETEVPPHSHPEDIFRIVIDGSLTVNGHEIEEGMWFVVRSDTEYHVETEEGYDALASYTSVCQTHYGS